MGFKVHGLCKSATICKSFMQNMWHQWIHTVQWPANAYLKTWNPWKWKILWDINPTKTRMHMVCCNLVVGGIFAVCPWADHDCIQYNITWRVRYGLRIVFKATHVDLSCAQNPCTRDTEGWRLILTHAQGCNTASLLLPLLHWVCDFSLSCSLKVLCGRCDHVQLACHCAVPGKCSFQ